MEPAESPTAGGAAPVATSAKSKHPAWLVKRAGQHGITPEEAEHMDVNEIRDEISLRRLEQVMLFQNPQTREAAEAAVDQPARPAKAAPQPPSPVAAADDLDLDENEYDPKLVRALKKLRERADERADEVKILKDKLTRLEKFQVDQQFQHFADRFDGWIDELDPAYHAFLGQGHRRALAPTSDAVKNRQEVLVHMDALTQTYRRLGRPVDEKRLFELAVQGLFGPPQASQAARAPAPAQPSREPEPQRDEADEVAEELLAQRRRHYQGNGNGAGLARPTQRNGTEPPSTTKAINTARTRLRELNLVESDRDLAEAFPS